MLTVSPEYLTQIDAPSRITRALLTLDFLPEINTTVTAIANSERVGYPVANLLRRRISLDETKGVGAYLPDYTRDKFDGWRSDTISDVNGVFEIPLVLELTYTQSVTVSNFWIVGTNEEHPTDFTFTVYDDANGITFEEIVIGNSKAIWNPLIPTSIVCKKVVITITKNSIPGKEVLLLNAGVVDLVVLSDNEVVDFELLEEITSNESLPFGGVSANMFSFSVDNMNRLFSPSNLKGPLTGLLGPGVIVTAYVGIEIVTDEYEYTPLGTYTVSEWRAPSQGVEASVVGYDRLFDLNLEPVPMLRIEQDTSIASLFAKLFLSLGLTADQFEIDSNITTVIPFGWVPTGVVKDALLQLSQAGMCRVSVNRLDKLIVKSSTATQVPNAVWTDDEHIMTIENPEKYNAVYGSVSVGINAPSLRRTIDLASMSNLVIPSGTTLFEKAEFSKKPVVLVEDVSVQNILGVTIGDVRYGSHHMSLTLDNPTASAETVTIAVKGLYCNFVKRELLGQIATSKVKKQLDVNNELVQTPEHAQAIMDLILPVIADTFAFFEIEARGNPALELYDVIQFSADTVSIDTAFIEIYRSVLKYDGALVGSIVGRRVK